MYKTNQQCNAQRSIIILRSDVILLVNSFTSCIYIPTLPSQLTASLSEILVVVQSQQQLREMWTRLVVTYTA